MKLLSMFSHKKSKKGFTLVELVIVIAVLAIIAAIAIPTVNGVIKNANQATDDSNAQAYTMTIKVFQAELEAQKTHSWEPTDPRAKLITTSEVSALLKAYGTSFAEIKSTGKVFHYDKATKTVTVAANTSTTPFTSTLKLDADLGIVGLPTTAPTP